MAEPTPQQLERLLQLLNESQSHLQRRAAAELHALVAMRAWVLKGCPPTGAEFSFFVSLTAEFRALHPRAEEAVEEMNEALREMPVVVAALTLAKKNAEVAHA